MNIHSSQVNESQISNYLGNHLKIRECLSKNKKHLSQFNELNSNKKSDLRKARENA